jgi:hypothetical protein
MNWARLEEFRRGGFLFGGAIARPVAKTDADNQNRRLTCLRAGVFDPGERFSVTVRFPSLQAHKDFELIENHHGTAVIANFVATTAKQQAGSRLEERQGGSGSRWLKGRTKPLYP